MSDQEALSVFSPLEGWVQPWDELKIKIKLTDLCQKGCLLAPSCLSTLTVKPFGMCSQNTHQRVKGASVC